ncbi:hypothetical protein KC845_04155 [Candidatus Kaiserbacteria bacterium]|nr:hypothetical protein [Candidatus Kaiserbacteria bacterium]
MPKLITVIFIISLSLLAVLHYIALELYLYWQIWWLDIPMHLFGGAIIVFGLYSLQELGILKDRSYSLLNILTAVLVIAIAWEVFQYLITTVMKDDFVVDTLSDIMFGLSGSLLGYTVAKRLKDLD